MKVAWEINIPSAWGIMRGRGHRKSRMKSTADEISEEMAKLLSYREAPFAASGFIRDDAVTCTLIVDVVFNACVDHAQECYRRCVCRKDIRAFKSYLF